MEDKKIYMGLDIGTDSVGYAVTDEAYNLKKFHGEPVWGVTIFDKAALCDERRGHRTARRRLDRRQQRVDLIQELFAEEINKVDPKFYIRIQESSLFGEDSQEHFSLFNDKDYTDKEYHNQYPTIHHLICDLMKNQDVHDVRLVYLACAWLAAHRGHFLSNISIENISSIKDFKTTYDSFMKFFIENEYEIPWKCESIDEIGEILKKKIKINEKTNALNKVLFNGKRPTKGVTEEFPFEKSCLVKLLAGGSCKLKDLFQKDEYSEFGNVSLNLDEEKYGEIMANIGDDFTVISKLRELHDWAMLADILGEYDSISEAKVGIYNQHKKDLATLKLFVKKYIPKKYAEVFREKKEHNYVSYSYHTNDGNKNGLKKEKSQEEFTKYILALFKNISPDEKDKKEFTEMIERLEIHNFMPKQKNTDNRVIPYQLYEYELNCILQNAARYLSFLNNVDEDGISTVEKIKSVFLFRIPYFVGPTNTHSSHAWLVRKQGKIYPWNFEKMVDLDLSEENFIKKMTNHCTYVPGEPVLAKDSLLYQKYMVLNEINNIRINGQKISVETKQDIFNTYFKKKKKVTRKNIVDYLISNGFLRRGEENLLSGIDININSSFSSFVSFRNILDKGILTENDVERIIERSSYAEDKRRLDKWLIRNYPQIEAADRKYICKIKINGFGRFSKKFLCELEGVSKETREIVTIIDELWNSNNNLMEILSEKYTFVEELSERMKEYYAEHSMTLNERMDEMFLSNGVRRPIYRTLAIVQDVVKAVGTPDKIFIEMTRGSDPSQKGKRTKTRKQQLLDIYAMCEAEDVRLLKEQLEAMGDSADNRLQSDKLFLYYLQFGKCMYSGEAIVLEEIGTKRYDIDHIYPQAYVKDDSIINNKVLVLSRENGLKKDIYPINKVIRDKMTPYWGWLRRAGSISEEKYKRLVRATEFTDDEKLGFINRQLTETSQSTKAVATLLKEKYPNTEIVYCKARLVSEFRQEFDLLKSRKFNDLHHAVDAYLNIVTGNVYNMKFTKKWFNVQSQYSIKTRTLFTRPTIYNGEIIWDGENMLAKVKKTAKKNNAHFTKYAFYKRGGLFDQNPVAASEGLVSLKKGMDSAKYGGYNKSSAMFYIPVRYKAGKKSELFILSVEMMYGNRFLNDPEFAKEYAPIRLQHILGKKIDEVSFPMGMRPWKVNTVLSLDGFKVCIAGIGSGGKCLVAQPIMQFSDQYEWQYYVKKLEMFVDKISENPKYIYCEEFDKVSKDKNKELYKLFLNKYENTIFKKRVNSPVEILRKGKDVFEGLNVQEQSIVLLNILQTFGRVSSGCNLTLIGGASKAAATVSFSATVSNWKKNYKDIRIIDTTVSGLWEKKSDNILGLL